MERWTHLASCVAMSAALSATTCKKSENQSTAELAASSQPPAADPVAAPENVAEPPADAERTASGLASVVLKRGSGTQRPELQDRVKVHYTGWTKQGTVFDTSHTRSLPATFKLSQVIKGWTEGLQLMVTGERRRFWIPADLAYGDHPSRPGTPAGPLTFDIELLEIIEGVKPPPTPSNVATPPDDAQRTQSGLASIILKPPADSDPPAPYDRVQFHYTGWTQAGRLFDSSLSRKTPAGANLFQVRPLGLREALSLMSVGEKRRFWVPAGLAQESAESQGVPSGQLTYDVEMVRITRLPPPPPVPPDVKSPPSNAKRTTTGLAYRVLKPGTGTVHPKATSTVEVRYTGWTPDGDLFDSSALRGNTAVFRLDRVIKGWAEGVQLMTEGEHTRFWIPSDLAYGEKPGGGAPSGELVFDIELIKIREKLGRVRPLSKAKASRTEALTSTARPRRPAASNVTSASPTHNDTTR